MRVDPKKLSEITRKTVQPTASEPVEPTGVAAAQPSAAAQPDQVILSQQAVEIQRAQEALSQVPEVRQQKVAEIKRKIVEGSLEVDAEAIAKKIIAGGI